MIACLSLLVGSCSDGEDNTGILNEPRITLSTWNVSFPGEGGIAAVSYTHLSEPRTFVWLWNGSGRDGKQ